ncbi:MAG: acylphosphatase [Brachybacterium tyrofermentans]|uniref:acylphosphatase n=1 Tax=Brachybacterium tyrofermentans TaxID=47848 RepID=UPI00186601AE|nr:acylphosphatase [Brachybacterium tyrofermentans]
MSTQRNPELASGSAEAQRRIVRVRGQVQGVGFRMAAASEAARLGVAGTVRNLWDGTVEADIEGAQHAVDAMLAWLRQGPTSAHVSGIDVRPEAPRGADSFRITG